MSDSRSHLEKVLDDAIRHGLRNAGVKGVLAPLVGAIMDSILAALQRESEPLSVDQVAEAIDRSGGFLRAGDDAIIEGRLVPAGVLISALLKLERDRLSVPDERPEGSE